ncbi:hypothetical protein PACTADRAFT_48547 [Pachysolen tannophilus NRRL Y-2460]|uniref:Methyltransferase type 11 domain-containing protein n=1 Tax=Pachysolen tannophilus NRRL Y-2460 TaxID=669874 RepID=A0A1E4TYC1_PACTA|nr:hypothetical protein PACTADRAFT_48547 [Pachysolen tannophilus NRRL Y-2460]
MSSRPSKEVIEKEMESFNTIETPVLKEELFVHKVYDEIAEHFSQTRYKPWPIVEKFLITRPDYSIGLDVGCGNGKYFNVNKKIWLVGSDRSEGLIKCATKYNSGLNNDAIVADGLFLPHHDNRFDFAISIAVIHHFSTEERRIEAIKRILSKLKLKTGQALIYCWALEQENSRRGYKEGMDQDILVPWVLQKKQEKRNKKEKVGVKDETVKESTTNQQQQESKELETKMRYYHMYKKGELVENAEKAGGVVIDHGYEKDNWWIIVKNA